MNLCRLLALLLLFTGNLTYSQPDYASALDSLLKANPHYNGAVLILKHGEVAAMQTQGIADTSDTPLSDTSAFNLASLSKHITALAAAKLMQEGKLDLQEGVGKYLVAMDQPKYDSLRVKHLIYHTSGLPDYEELFKQYPSYAEPYGSNTSLLKLFSEKSPALKFTPGSRQEYSNTGYIILASIVEEISGKTLGDYLQETFFTPLKMEQAFLFSHDYPNPHPWRVKGLKFTARGTSLNDLTRYDGVVGDGNVYFSLQDFIKWEKFLSSGASLNEEYQDLYFHAAKDLPSNSMPYAFGWMAFDYKQMMQHTGGWVGFSNFYHRDLKNGFVMLILSNGSMDERQFVQFLKDVLSLKRLAES